MGRQAHEVAAAPRRTRQQLLVIIDGVGYSAQQQAAARAELDEQVEQAACRARVGQAVLDGRGKPASMDAERIATGLNVSMYHRDGGWYWSASHEAYDQLAMRSPLPIEGGPYPRRREAANDALTQLSQALAAYVRWDSTRVVRS